MRRSGKTWYLYRHIRKLVDDGVPPETILYVNFEDDRLHPLEEGDLALVEEAFYNRDRRCGFLLDETHNVPGWERSVRRFLDTLDVELVLTGSSAKPLGREIATSLRGRALSHELLPFSFFQALVHRHVEIPKHWPPPSRARSKLESEWEGTPPSSSWAASPCEPFRRGVGSWTTLAISERKGSLRGPDRAGPRCAWSGTGGISCDYLDLLPGGPGGSPIEETACEG